jgi:hypothetical protein
MKPLLKTSESEDREILGREEGLNPPHDSSASIRRESGLALLPSIGETLRTVFSNATRLQSRQA